MRQSERDRWIAEYAAQREAFDAERQRWQEERERLIDALLSGSTGDFIARQKARPAPIAELPREAREPKPHAMGF
jgi:hypothetical protein